MSGTNIENDDRRLAWIGIYSGAITAVGAALLSIGFSIMIITGSFFHDLAIRGAKPEDYPFLNYLNSNLTYFLVMGAAFLIVGVGGGYVHTHRRTNHVHKQVLPTWHTHNRLERSARIATIVGTAIAAITLPLIVVSMYSSDMQLQNTIKQVNSLTELTEKSNQQLVALNNTITEIHHQTIVSAYVNGGAFHLKLENCGTNNESTLGGSGKTLGFSPVMYNEKNVPTPIQFLSYLNFEYRGIGNSTDVSLGINSTSMRLIDPPKQEQWHLDLTDTLNNAKNQGIPKVRIILTSYTFAPYSDAKNEILTKYNPWNVSRPILTEFAYKNGNWEMENNPSFLCTQNSD